MSDTQHEARVDDDSTTAQSQESDGRQEAAMTVARLLANPRRIRRA